MGNGIMEVMKLIEEVKPLLKVRKGHPLEKKDEYTKELYVTLLVGAIEKGSALGKNQTGFLLSLFQSVGLKIEIERYIELAAKVDKEFLFSFITYTQKEKLQHIFLIDLLLLFAMEGDVEEKAFNFAGEMADVLGVSEQEIKFLCKMVICILEEDGVKFKKLAEEKPSSIALNDFKPYVMDFIEGYPIQETYLNGFVEWSGNLIITRPIFNEGILKVNSSKMIFEKEGKIISRKGSKVFIQNAEIKNGEWIFEEMSALRIEDTKFKENVDKRPVSIYRCNKEAGILNSTFENCQLYGEKNGGAIEIIDSTVRLERLTLSNCSTSGYGGGIFINSKRAERCTAKGIEFYGCVADYGGGVYIIEEEIQYFFIDCIWKHCKAMVGGGIWRAGGKRIEPCIINCEFHECGIAYEGKRGGYAGSHFMNYADVTEAIENCRFDQCEANPVYAY